MTRYNTESSNTKNIVS